MNVRSPRNDVFGMAELLRFSAQFHAQHRFQPGLACRRADGAVELRSPKAMKETPIHRRTIEHSQRTAVGIRQNRLAAELARDRTEFRGDLIQSFIPGNSPPDLALGGDDRPRPSRSEAPLFLGTLG